MTTVQYEFDMTSAEYGTETFTGYLTREEALAGIDRVMANAAALNDSVVRYFTDVRESVNA